METRRMSSSLRSAAGGVTAVTALMGMTVTADGKAGFAGAYLAVMAFAWLAVTREREDRPQELRRTVHVPGTRWPLCSRKTLEVVGTALTFCLFATAVLSRHVEVRVAAAVLAGGMVLAGVATGWNANRIDDITSSKVFLPGLGAALASGLLGLGLAAFNWMGGGVDFAWVATLFLPMAATGATLGLWMVFCLVAEHARDFRDGRQQNESGKAIGSASPVEGVDQPV